MIRVGVGISDFKEIIETNNFYADKSLLIKDLIDFNDKVTLITRPRRFGKTLNLDMLRYFFSHKHKDDAKLFYNLQIWKQGADYQEHQGRYPTIVITFKNNKKDTLAEALASFKVSLAKTYGEFEYLLSSGHLSQVEEQTFKAMLYRTATDEDLQRSIGDLCEYLHRAHNTKVLLLIDEYDTPMQAGFLNGYWEEMADFMRGLFGAALKDNRFLYKGVVTGITRIAKENLFSGINNLSVYSILDQGYSEYFGLTEAEVRVGLEALNLQDKLDTVRDWYNGYIFGQSTELYNPWSVINFLARKVAEPYWSNTSDNALIKKYARMMAADGKLQLEQLIRGEEIEALIEKQMVYSDLDDKGVADRMWNLFLISGYLQCTGENEKKKGLFKLKVPNKEIMSIFEQTVTEWFEASVVRPIFLEFIKALLTGNVRLMESHLGFIAEQTFSHFDTAFDQAESFYHAFVLGMLMHLRDRFYIDSNKQSGYGRYDICLEPMDKKEKGIIIEFKSFNPRLGHKDWDDVAQEALKQIEDRKYQTELIKRGVHSIIKLAIVFRGQQVKVFEGASVEVE